MITLFIAQGVGGTPQAQGKKPANANAPAETPVRNPIIYTFSPDSAVVTIDKVEVKNILLKNDKADCDHELLSMTWTMLAKSIAKDVYGQDIDDAKANTLASILARDNYAYQTPAEILKKQGLPFMQSILSILRYGHRSQYYGYKHFLLGAKAWIQWGKFPANLPVKISGEFKNALAQPAAPQAAPKAAKKARRLEKSAETEPVGASGGGCSSGQKINPMTGECVDVEQ
jgi:hypothetical protein